MSLFNQPQVQGGMAGYLPALGSYGSAANLFGGSSLAPQIDPSIATDPSMSLAPVNYGGLTMPTAGVPGATPGGGGLLASLSDMLGGFGTKTNADGSKVEGWGGTALGLGQAALGAFMAMKQYGLAKDTLAENKRQFGLNYDAQKTTTNSALEDRQRARVASNAGAYQSVGDYMNANGIK